ncbi:MAG: hypothetical protein CM1200mP30_22350 [Pseudomonadota bacterium]|nr:MAG: hypothetical protein CM1200mP30_22350 [Pseudomonadota bacterium]
MIKGFIDGIPLGHGRGCLLGLRFGADTGSFLKVVIPMALPGVITAGIFCFILAWNEFLFALIITTNKAVTFPVGLSLFHAEEGVLWHLISAAGIMIMLPMFVLATFKFKKNFVQGPDHGGGTIKFFFLWRLFSLKNITKKLGRFHCSE